ncbi:hypothetical protein CKA32_000147 [Geitlerinema sp. FC II]|nr:hypothetical protein CKA32_000147 [Geitlerinema sp. FC II]
MPYLLETSGFPRVSERRSLYIILQFNGQFPGDRDMESKKLSLNSRCWDVCTVLFL